MARGINKVILVGNLGNDPEMKYTAGGMAICTLSLATTSVRKDKDGQQIEKTEWHRVKLFGKLGEIAGEYLKKGRQVYIEGSIRYDKFTGGKAWATEYGSSSNAADFAYLIKYSPLQNARPACYPATLVTTADHDDRVVPSHSFRFTAAMQEAQTCANPVLIRVETKASHGYRPTDKRIAELADQWAFAAAAMGMKASK